MYDRIVPGHGSPDQLVVTDVPLDDVKAIVIRKYAVAVQHEIQYGNLVAFTQERRNECRADVSAASGNKDSIECHFAGLELQ
jgi:hypothetical protein